MYSSSLRELFPICHRNGRHCLLPRPLLAPSHSTFTSFFLASNLGLSPLEEVPVVLLVFFSLAGSSYFSPLRLRFFKVASGFLFVWHPEKVACLTAPAAKIPPQFLDPSNPFSALQSKCPWRPVPVSAYNLVLRLNLFFFFLKRDPVPTSSPPSSFPSYPELFPCLFLDIFP